ncbi:hypothetical protein BJI56_11715 [Acinetobacter nosocomialis]|nr:hypothetical protein BJI56_11715 [Acinetobacter nosocomialis]
MFLHVQLQLVVALELELLDEYLHSLKIQILQASLVEVLKQQFQPCLALLLSVSLFLTHAVNNSPAAIAAQIKSFLFAIALNNI